MLFNSIEFLLFFSFIFGVYWTLKKGQHQNILLLFASYSFYAAWDWRFLSLIFLSSFADFTIAKFLEKNKSKNTRQLLLSFSVILNLGLLFTFKYFNFFQDSLIDVFKLADITLSPITLSLILPIGISFYTFQTLGYTIDVYNRKVQASTDTVKFFTYVAFFPQLIAGPIERAKNLLPQFDKKRQFSRDDGVQGLRQILWGFFKKVVIADNAAILVDAIFVQYSELSGFILFLGAILFAIQIYGDFSGYSDIAIGSSRLLGIHLCQNFATPYFSRDIGEFWRRWHISLSSWFKDYLYIPIGGSKGGLLKTIRNIFIIFLVSGLWHGANWNFVFWGLFHSLLFLPLLVLKKNRNHIQPILGRLPSIKETFQILVTFIMVSMAWIFFRSETLDSAFAYISRMFFGPNNYEAIIPLFKIQKWNIAILIISVFLGIIVEWVNRKNSHGLAKMSTYKPVRFIFYFCLSILIMEYFNGNRTFIYFQF